MTPDGLESRMAVLESKVGQLCDDLPKRLDAIEAAVLGLRLHEARMEWAEKALWIVMGVALTAVGTGLLMVLRSGVVPSAKW